ncbi:MAG: GHKL domain-containing protein [Lachnospiraceae bacterium]|nr:GHKL domain-containing protein [Lachnospiraceae bacterium]
MITSPVFWTIFKTLVDLFQGFLLSYFIFRLLNPRWPGRLLLITFSLLAAGYQQLFFSGSLQDNTLVSFLGFYVIILFYTFLFFTDPWWVKTLWMIVLFILYNVFSAGSYAASSLLAAFPEKYLFQRNLFQLIFLLSGNLLLLLLFSLIIRLFSPLKTHQYLSPLQGIVLILINLADILMHVMYVNNYMEGRLSEIAFCFIEILTMIVPVMSLVLYRILYIYAENVTRYQLKEARRSEIENRLSEVTHIYTETQKIQHDFYKHLQVIDSMINENHLQESREYLKSVLESVPVLFTTGCLPLDSALASRDAVLQKEQIEFTYELCDLRNLPLSDFDFCSIIMNLLDNAAEAVRGLDPDHPDRYIHLQIKHVRDMLLIRCENSCSPLPLKKKNGRFVSNKKEQGHGFGLQIIEDTAVKIGGTCSFSQEKSIFTALVNLPFPDDAPSDDLKQKFKETLD